MNKGLLTPTHKVKAYQLITALSFATLPVMGYSQETSVELDALTVSAEETERVRKESEESLGVQYMQALPMQRLAGDELVQRRQGGLGETLAGMPGVHLDSFGGGASRPVIRGQTLPRIAVLSDGMTIHDVASISPDHAVATDPLLLDEIEVIRGPAATIYGGNALNGAINLIDGKIPKKLPKNGITGAAEMRYGTGDNERTAVGRVTTAIGQLALHAEGMRHIADDYDVPGSFGTHTLKDSYSENSSTALGASWITDQGYIGAAYTLQRYNYGLPGHTHSNAVCHTHANSALHCQLHAGDTDPFAGINDDDTAYIKLRSERYDVRADYEDLFPGITNTRLRVSHTNYLHEEIDGDTLFADYGNKGWDVKLEFTHAPVMGFVGTFGLQASRMVFVGLDDNSRHDTERWVRESFDFATKNEAIFLTEKRSFGPVDVVFGLRQEVQRSRINWDSWARRAYFPTNLKPFSASVGATWHLDESYSISLDVARSQRAPNVRELYAYGNNLSTNTLEAGLVPSGPLMHQYKFDYKGAVLEKASTINLTLRKEMGSTTFEVGAFYSDIDNYVYGKLLDAYEGDIATFRYLLYTPAHVVFTGVDGQITQALSYDSSVTLFGDYVHADLKDEDDELPRMSPGRLGTRYNWNSGPIAAELEYYRTFAQDTYASYETRTSGYNMVNATLSYRFELERDQSAMVYLRGTNLTNELAYSHTTFVKDQSPLRGRSLTMGVRYEF
ncbi:TonB-dependent receptor domain-containing protein [Pseudomonas monteilii]|uniref:TonB-dependent receptor domain-containing protein n=1 Tax=Pseudomonas monteilii TaxID=76759 RepID=UPI003CFC4603